MCKTILFLCFNFLIILGFGQSTQNVRGRVTDAETHAPIFNARVKIIVASVDTIYGAMTADNGTFSISNVPIGKHQLSVFVMGYDEKFLTIDVNSGKETLLELTVTESFYQQTQEVEVVGRRKGEVINELAFVSARQFSVEETNLYAGSRSDPARMASNFAGVQGSDDSRNDIVVRGNSPLGVVYKLEGVDIPNPSHFAVAGSTGGPVAVINSKILANSDFFMSAFPAEYGNSTAAIFDLKLRNGNNRQHELTAQFGFLGTELFAEGPLNNKNNASYIVMGRYSTLSIFETMGIKIGTDAVPTYWDGAFKLNWNLKKGGNLSFFGMGGDSDIEIMISEQEEFSTELYGEGDRDQYFGTAMAVSGLNYKKNISEKTFITSTLAYSFDQQRSQHNYLIRHLDTINQGTNEEKYQIAIDSIYKLMNYKYTDHKVSYHLAATHKFNSRHLIKVGGNIDVYSVIQIDSTRPLVTDTFFEKRWDFKGQSALAQLFVQWKWRASEKTDITAGLHGQYFSLSESISPIEPRIAWRTRLSSTQSVFAGAGLHSQTQPLYTYTYHKIDSLGNKIFHNKKMDFTKSVHTSLGYNVDLPKRWNVKTEVYFQYLYDIPVTVLPSSYSLINMGAGFQRFFPDSLKNTGTGKNYGVELTVQKFFDNTFFFLTTASLYDSRYTGSDGIERNTSYNGNYVVNVLAGKDFKINGKNTVLLGIKATYAGGQRYGYVDVIQTQKLHELTFLDDRFNTRRFRNYFRFDLKINWKLNTHKTTHELGLDLVNVFNLNNILSLAYAPNLADPTAEPIAEKKQLGFLPIFYYKIDLFFQAKEKQTK